MKPLERKSGALDHDLSLDGDKVRFVLRPNRYLVISSYFFTPAFLGVALGGLAWYILFYKLYYSPKYDLWAVYSAASVPIIGIAIGLLLAIPRLFVRYEVSRRYIRVISGIFIESVENVDMKRVKDTSMTRYGPVSTITVMSTDKTVPTLAIPFIPTDQASEAFLFINDVAIDSRTELLLATTRKTKGIKSEPPADLHDL